MPQFKGIPISSHSQAEGIPVEVVSQPSYKDIDEKLNATYESKTDTEQVSENVPQRVEIDFGVAEETTKEIPIEAKKEAVRAGKIKVSELTTVDFDDFMHSSIVALPKRMPTMLDVRAKDPNFRLRWVNCKADGGRRVDECKAMGFTIAKVDEVVGLGPDSIMVDNGEDVKNRFRDCIKYHDVLLMKVPTTLLYGWLKQNALDSSSKVSPRRLHQAAKNEAIKSFHQGLRGEAGQSFSELKDSIQFYTPSDNEVPNG